MHAENQAAPYENSGRRTPTDSEKINPDSINFAAMS